MLLRFVTQILLVLVSGATLAADPVSMAFTGVVLGLFDSRYMFSLYTIS